MALNNSGHAWLESKADGRASQCGDTLQGAQNHTHEYNINIYQTQEVSHFYAYFASFYLFFRTIVMHCILIMENELA